MVSLADDRKTFGCFIHFIEALSGIGALAVIAVILRKRHSATFCKELDSFPIVQIIVLHCKSDNISACSAAKAVKILFVRVNMAGRGFFVVKRAEANIISACSFEGNLDVISLNQAGFENAVASCGTALTPEQAKIISNYADNVVMPDM